MEEKVKAWRRLPLRYHNDQRNMCRFYAKVDDQFLDEGLRLYEMKHENATDIANEIRRVARDESCMLCTAYSRLLGNVNAKAPAFDPDLRKLKEDAGNDLQASHRWHKVEPLPSVEVDRTSMQWSEALLDRPYYSVALKRANNLDKWCAGRWGKVPMSWEEINAFKDDDLLERDRLVYWLLRVWRTHSHLLDEPTVPAI